MPRRAEPESAPPGPLQGVVRLVGILLMLTALLVALTQVPDRSVDSLVARWAPPPSDFMELRGQLVHFRDQGPRDDPQPLVLLHATADSLQTWDGWAAALRGRRRVIAFDLPGNGLTGPFAGDYPRDDYRADTLARFTLDVMDALHVRTAVLGGNGLGGEVAWRVATIAPARVGRLVLVDAFEPAANNAPIEYALAAAPVLGRIGEWLTARPVVEQAVRAGFGDPARVGDTLVDRHLEMLTREGNRRALTLRLRVAPDDRAPARLASVHVPTLILWGANDRLAPPALATRLQQAIAGSRLVVLPGLGHVPQEEDPRASVAPVRAFLGLDGDNPRPAAPAASEPA